MLVENFLVAVVSLPAGVFKPYSGVKTSILILDKSLVKRTSRIAFFKVENDGFDLGDQRLPIDTNDLPKVQIEIAEYLNRLRVGKSIDDFQPTFGLLVEKKKTATSGEYNLSGDRHRESFVIPQIFPMVAIKEVARVESGFGFPTKFQGQRDGDIPFLKVSDMNLPGNEIQIVSWNHAVSRDVVRELKAKVLPKGTIIFPKIGAAIATNKKRILTRDSTYDNNIMGIITDAESLLPTFFYYYLSTFDLSIWASDAQPPSMRKTIVEQHQIPLPPLEVQREIVAEIEGYQEEITKCELAITKCHENITKAINKVWRTDGREDSDSYRAGMARAEKN